MRYFRKKSTGDILIVGIGGKTCSGKGVVTEFYHKITMSHGNLGI